MWRQLRQVDVMILNEKIERGIELTEVEKMILNPYSIAQAQQQVKSLNRESFKGGTSILI